MTKRDEVSAEKVADEDELMFGYQGESRDPTDLLSDYLPEKQDYGAKTVLTKDQVHLLAALEQLSNFYPELEHREGLIRTWIAAYEKRTTSVNGLSRSEFLEILVSMSGGSVDKEEREGILQQVLGADMGGKGGNGNDTD